MVDTDLNASHAVILEPFATEKFGNSLVFKVGIGQLTVQGRPFGETVKITDAVFLDITGVVSGLVCIGRAFDILDFHPVERTGNSVCSGFIVG